MATPQKKAPTAKSTRGRHADKATAASRSAVNEAASPAKGAPAAQRKPGVESTHAVTAGQPVTYETSGHPPRSDSPTYVKSRAALKEIASSLNDWYFGKGPYQDHHGGGLWVNDGKGWFLLRNLVGIEWSGQFCADPGKVDALRRNAARLYARFPESFDAFRKLGIDLKDLLATPITDAAAVSRWTDSICNASVPLPQPLHIGTVPKGGGVHDYPTPVTDIDRFRRDDFRLWVTDAEGQPAAVVPQAHLEHRRHEAAGQHLELPAGHPLAEQAFRRVKRR